jgi:hypothetical protein
MLSLSRTDGSGLPLVSRLFSRRSRRSRKRRRYTGIKRHLLFAAYLTLGSVAVAFGGSLAGDLPPAGRWSEPVAIESVTGQAQSLAAALVSPEPTGETRGQEREDLATDVEPAPAPSVTARSKKPVIAPKSKVPNVNITFYDCKGQGFCGAMYNGRKVYQGAAACSWNIPIGTRFKIAGDTTRRIYTCEDRGLLEDTWVDVYWENPRDGWKWQNLVGRYSTIEIVSLPR